MCRYLDTIPACVRRTDGRTDGNAIASTALAMRALRRAVKIQLKIDQSQPNIYTLF